MTKNTQFRISIKNDEQELSDYLQNSLAQIRDNFGEKSFQSSLEFIKAIK